MIGELRHGAHHMLNEVDDPAIRKLVAPVVVALGGIDRAEAVPVAADAALHAKDARAHVGGYSI